MSSLVRLSRALAPTLRSSSRYSAYHLTSITRGDGFTRMHSQGKNLVIRSLSATNVNVDVALNGQVSVTGVPRRVKTADVKQPSDEIIAVKGWVKTVRKQKMLAFVEVNDGSSLSGIQCVLSFDSIDENIKNGKL